MASSVNKPTDPKTKEKDVNQKLQLYGIYSAFAKGKVPSNKQIDIAMNSALATRALASPSPKLSNEGKVLVNDVRDVIEKAKLLLLTKNEGNLIQDFIYQTQGVTTGNAQKPGAPLNKDEAKQHGNEALEGLRTLGTLLVSNGQFRKLLNDAVILARDMAGEGAQKVADKARPSEEQLNQIDQPAEDNTWHDVPNMSPAALKAQAKERYEANKPFGKEDIKNAANHATNQANTQGTNQDAAAQGAAAGGQTLKEQASANIPEETKQKGREAFDKTKNYLDGKVPKERREQVIWRLKKMVVEIQGHEDYQRAIDTLLRLAETYQGHAKSVSGDSAGAVKELHKATQPMLIQLKTLLERFANGTSMDDFFDAVNQIYRDADNDPELKQFFKDLDNYIRKCLKEQGYILQDNATEEWNRIYDKGHFLTRERYRKHFDRLLEEVKLFGKEFDNDPYNKAFAASMDKLFKDLGNDPSGKPTFKPDLLKDVSQVILPAVFENIRYIPIPRIEYSDPTADLVIENLIIEGDNLAPNVFEFGSDNYFRWGRKKITNQNKNKVMVAVSGIQMDIRDVSYYVQKKQGFPSITDTGVMDIFLGGTGLSFKIAMETADKSDKEHFFKINSVTVDIKHMDIKLKKSKFKLLFSLFKPLMFKVMKPVIQKVVEAQLRENVRKLDAFCYDIHQDAKKAERQAKENPDQAVNIFQLHWQAYQQRMAEIKQKKEDAKKEVKEANARTNIAMTQHDSIFPNISLPGGISTKATEFKDLAMKGDKWESPVFSIGTAQESTNIPKAPTIQRKSGTGNYTQTNGTQSFSREVNNAFQSDPTSLQKTSDVNTTTTTTTSTVTNTTGTTLGASNPVLTGNV